MKRKNWREKGEMQTEAFSKIKKFSMAARLPASSLEHQIRE
jgi:hypothetical protein